MARFLRILPLLFLYSSFNCYSQGNLVPNWSFEDTIKCINNVCGFTSYVADWNGQGGGGGLCYCTAQCPNAYMLNVPKNDAGFQYARTGVSYALIYTYISDTATNRFNHGGGPGWQNFRNYIQAHLISSLNNGTKYFVTFYVSLANTSEFACNDIGAYLSDSALKFDTVTKSMVKWYIKPQIANNPVTNPLTDTLNWLKVTGSYIAKGGEKYIIIGNFLSDTTSHIVYLPWNYNTGTTASYYYIDDVVVSTDSLLASVGGSTAAAEAKAVEVKVFPNPANTKLNIEIPVTEGRVFSIYLFNNMGQLILGRTLQSGLTMLHLDTFSNGLYYYRITDSQGNLIKADKQLIIH